MIPRNGSYNVKNYLAMIEAAIIVSEMINGLFGIGLAHSPIFVKQLKYY